MVSMKDTFIILMKSILILSRVHLSWVNAVAFKNIDGSGVARYEGRVQ